MEKQGGSIKWATAKHALRCLIGWNIGEGVGAAWDICMAGILPRH
jgi:hypothetical protein